MALVPLPQVALQRAGYLLDAVALGGGGFDGDWTNTTFRSLSGTSIVKKLPKKTQPLQKKHTGNVPMAEILGGNSVCTLVP